MDNTLIMITPQTYEGIKITIAFTGIVGIAIGIAIGYFLFQN